MYSKMPTKPKICIFFRFGLPTIEADDIGRKAVADCIESLLVNKICLSQPHKMLEANKVLRFARSSKKILANLQNINSQLRA